MVLQLKNQRKRRGIKKSIFGRILHIYRYDNVILLRPLLQRPRQLHCVFGLSAPIMIKLKSLLEVKIARVDLENPQFMSGVNLAIQDKKQGHRRSLRGLPDDFVRGYKVVGQESWWEIINSKLADWAGRFGQSYGDRGIWRSK